MDGDAWYYAAGQEQKGPLTFDQISTLVKSGVIDRDDLVWMPKMEDWMQVSETELAPLLTRSPPVAPLRPPPPESGAFTPTAMTNFAAVQADEGLRANFVNAIKVCFAKFITWHGRASRPELWYFVLFGFGVLVAAMIIDSILSENPGGAGVFTAVAEIVLLLPNLAVGARRLHDTNRSGVWLLLSLVPIFGTIALMVFWSQPGTPGENTYGMPDTPSFA